MTDHVSKIFQKKFDSEDIKQWESDDWLTSSRNDEALIESISMALYLRMVMD